MASRRSTRISSVTTSSSLNSTSEALELEPTPKVIGKIKNEWNPLTILVSFKLETNFKMLE